MFGPTPTHRFTRTRRGFSLVELVLTLVIVGLVAAMAVPRYADALSRYRIDAAANHVVAFLENAQTEAAATSADVTVWFRVFHNQLEVTARATSYDPTLTYQTPLDEDPYFCDLVSANFGGDIYLVFDGYGKPDSGGTATLQVGGLTRTITVNAETGKATIQ
ncbi:MAG: prepilin-type N-terminal cleavage/methylation domain-containing protein [Planctomycetota bacterium]